VPRFVNRLVFVNGVVASGVVAKTRFPRVVISSGSVNDVRLDMYRNVLSGMVVRLVVPSKVIEENADSQNTELVKLVTLEGILTEPGPAL
jgi:hypothetical protein